MSGTRTVWQVSGGPANRTYVDDFLRHGVALIGPGAVGAWTADQDSGDDANSFVQSFGSRPRQGDIFLLRAGMSTIRAVGLVASDYLYLDQFDDVNGWDLRHARRVRWMELPTEYDFGSPVFGANPRRFSKVGVSDVIEYAHSVVDSPPSSWQTSPLPNLPAVEPLLENVPAAIKDILALASDLVPLMRDKKRFGKRPSEHEMVAHFVVPFLRALGWHPERIALEWNGIDVAIFDALPRKKGNLRYLIEAKKFGAGVEGALGQARGYAKKLGLVRDVVVTDGIRYRMYAGDQDFAPVAYANLGRLKLSATELFKRMKRP